MFEQMGTKVDSWMGSTAQRDIESAREITLVYLGGSRRMAQRQENESLQWAQETIDINPDTDYDYYATFSNELYRMLVSRGWRNTGTNREYYDSEALEILEKDDHQIVLRKDALFYHNVFERIPVWFYINQLWKRNTSVCREMIQPTMEALFEVAR